MKADRSLSLLKDLPDEILCHISDYLNSVNVSRTCYQLHSLFQPNIRAIKANIAAELLWHVNNADYAQVIKIVQKYPALMFVSMQDPNELSSSTTPLKLSFKHYDTDMWKKTLFPAIKACPAYRAAFFKQKEEQTDQISLAPLFAAYKILNQQIEEADERWFEVNNLAIYAAVDAACLSVGAELSKLPKHFLKTFSSGSDEMAWAFQQGQWTDPSDAAVFNRAYMRWAVQKSAAAFDCLFKERKAELYLLDRELISKRRSKRCAIS